VRIVAGARLADGSSLREKIAIEPLGDVKASTLEASESSSESLYGAVAQIASLPVSYRARQYILLFTLFFLASYNPSSPLRPHPNRARALASARSGYVCLVPRLII
jgi:hypothetical protein